MRITHDINDIGDQIDRIRKNTVLSLKLLLIAVWVVLFCSIARYAWNHTHPAVKTTDVPPFSEPTPLPGNLDR